MRVEISSNFAVSMPPKGVAFGQAGSTRLDSLKKSFRPYFCQSFFTKPQTTHPGELQKVHVECPGLGFKLSGSLGTPSRRMTLRKRTDWFAACGSHLIIGPPIFMPKPKLMM